MAITRVLCGACQEYVEVPPDAPGRYHTMRRHHLGECKAANALDRQKAADQRAQLLKEFDDQQRAKAAEEARLKSQGPAQADLIENLQTDNTGREFLDPQSKKRISTRFVRKPGQRGSR